MEAAFARYDDEFRSLNESITRKINLIPTLFAERRKTAVRDAEREIEEEEALLRSMEKDSRLTNRLRLQDRGEAVRADIATHRKNLKRAQLDVSGARENLLAGARPDDIDRSTMDQRSELLYGTNRLEAANTRLSNVHRLAAENENIAINITETLNKDRETLMRAKDKLEFVDETMDDSRRIIRNMARRVATNRCILAVIILLLLGAIGLILYLSWGRKSSSSHPSPPPPPPTSAPAPPTPAPSPPTPAPPPPTPAPPPPSASVAL